MTRLSKIITSLSFVVIFISLVSLAALRFYPKEKALPKPDEPIDVSVRVAVLNGCGREGLASLFVNRLRALGFDVVNGSGGNADSYDFSTSVVIDRKGNKTSAKKVADALGIEEIIDQYSLNPYIIEEVVVIIGRDWNSLLHD